MDKYEEIENIQKEVKSVKERISKVDEIENQLATQLKEVRAEKESAVLGSNDYKEIEQREKDVLERLGNLHTGQSRIENDVKEKIKKIRDKWNDEIEDNAKKIMEKRELIQGREVSSLSKEQEEMENRNERIEYFKKLNVDLASKGVDITKDSIARFRTSQIEELSEQNKIAQERIDNVQKNKEDRSTINELVARNKKLKEELKLINFDSIEKFEIPERIQEEPTQEKPAQEEAAQEKSVQEEPVQEEPVQEEPTQEKPAQEEAAQEKPAQEEPTQEKPVQEKPVQEKPVQEEPVPEELEPDLINIDAKTNKVQLIVNGKKYNETDVVMNYKVKKELYKRLDINEKIREYIGNINIFNVWNIKRKLDPSIVKLLEDDRDLREYIQSVHLKELSSAIDINYDLRDADEETVAKISKYAKYAKDIEYVNIYGELKSNNIFSKIISSVKGLFDKNKLNSAEKREALYEGVEDPKALEAAQKKVDNMSRTDGIRSRLAVDVDNEKLHKFSEGYVGEDKEERKRFR